MKYVILLLVLASCSPTYQACKEKFGTDTTVVYRNTYLTVHDTVLVAGEVKQGEWDLQELLNGDTLTESTDRTTLTIYKFKDRIIHKWHTKDSVIYRYKTIHAPCKELTTNNFAKPKDGFKWWYWLLIAIVLIAVGYFINSTKK